MELTCAACPGFVEFVERGETASDQVYVLAERLLAPIREAKVDTLLLGCTHYPFLARTISDVVGRDVVLVSSADETAFELRAALEGTERSRSGAVAGVPDVDLLGGHGDVSPAGPTAARSGDRPGRGLGSRDRTSAILTATPACTARHMPGPMGDRAWSWGVTG